MATLTAGRRPGKERGSQLVEFALVLPLLLLLVLGIMDFGLLFQRYEAVTNAAREGARIAVLESYSPTDVENRVQQYLTDAGLAGNTAITIVLPDQAMSAAGSCFTVTGATVFYPNRYLFLGPMMNYFGKGSFGSKMISATSFMRYEGPAKACS